MEVELKPEAPEKNLRIDKVPYGKTFFYAGNYYMRVRNYCDGKCLAVDLMSGDLATVSKDANLTPIDFKVVEV